MYRYQSGHWKLRKTVTVHVKAYSAASSKYTVKTMLPYAGSWRVRAYRANSAGGSYSAYRYLHAK